MTLLNNLFTGLVINEKAGYEAVINSPSITTALSPHIGYHKAAELASLMKDKKINIFEANDILKLMDESKLKAILEPGNLLKLGFSLEDLDVHLNKYSVCSLLYTIHLLATISARLGQIFRQSRINLYSHET